MSRFSYSSGDMSLDSITDITAPKEGVRPAVGVEAKVHPFLTWKLAVDGWSSGRFGHFVQIRVLGAHWIGKKIIGLPNLVRTQWCPRSNCPYKNSHPDTQSIANLFADSVHPAHF